jgi:hypothetical protein
VQYFFILWETARLAAADICRVFVVAVLIARRASRRRLGSASSGNRPFDGNDLSSELF